LRSIQAAAGYQRGLDLEPGNESLKSGLAEVQSAQARAADSSGAGGIGNLFTQPDALGKIATHPSTAAYLQQPDFVSMLTEVQRTPGSFNKYMSDPRMMQVLGVLLGVDIHTRGPDDQDTASTGGRQQHAAPKARQPEPEVEMTGAPAVCRLGWLVGRLPLNRLSFRRG
jgi:stress-induced-phosphoprotein 1